MNNINKKNVFFNYLDSGDNIESHHASNPSRKKFGKDLQKSKTFLRSILILFLSVIILTLTLLTYLGAFITLDNMTSPPQTVTVSSEGPAAEMYPDYMGQYNVLREVYRYDRAVYKHVDREDRFIIYAGKM